MNHQPPTTFFLTAVRDVVITPEVLPEDWSTELFSLCVIVDNREPKTVVQHSLDAIKSPYEAQVRNKSGFKYPSQTCKSNYPEWAPTINTKPVIIAKKRKSILQTNNLPTAAETCSLYPALLPPLWKYIILSDTGHYNIATIQCNF